MASGNSEEIIAFINVQSECETWNKPMADWRATPRPRMPWRKLFGLFAGGPKPPKDAREEGRDKNWTDTIALDDASIPKILSRVAEFESAAKAFNTAPPGWEAKSHIMTHVWIGRSDQFPQTAPDKLGDALIGLQSSPFAPSAPSLLWGANINVGTIMDAMDGHSSAQRLSETLRQRDAKLNAAACEATTVQAPIKIQKALRLKTP